MIVSSAIVCTLFEGHYHYGVAGLVNSLNIHGYCGDVFVGYRGELPDWAEQAKTNDDLNWAYAKTLDTDSEIRLHFLPVDTDAHLTNYKPEFFLHLWKSCAKDANAIVYFDPDIVIKCQWVFFEKWVQYGVALVHEITSNDMPPNHPVRKMWEKVIVRSNKQVIRNLTAYMNGGFIGVAKTNMAFVQTWLDIMHKGYEHFGLKPDQFIYNSYDRTHEFFAQDQDGLNIAAMCCDVPLSEYGPEAMDFIYGGKIMSHAIGAPKPWKKKFFAAALGGNPPTLAEKEYWNYANGVIQPYKNGKVKYKQIAIKIASFIGRFYRKY